MSATQPGSGGPVPPPMPMAVKQEKPDENQSTTAPAAVAAVQPTPPTPATADNIESDMTEKDRNLIAKEIANILNKSKTFKRKQTKEDKKLTDLNAIAATLLGSKLNFEMKVDQATKKIQLDCTNSKFEINQFTNAIKAAKGLGRGRGRGRRGRGRGRGGRGSSAASGLVTNVRNRRGRRSVRRASRSSGRGRGRGRGNRRMGRGLEAEEMEE